MLRTSIFQLWFSMLGCRVHMALLSWRAHVLSVLEGSMDVESSRIIPEIGWRGRVDRRLW